MATEMESALVGDAGELEVDASQLKEAIHHLSEGENSALHRIHEARAQVIDVREQARPATDADDPLVADTAES